MPSQNFCKMIEITLNQNNATFVLKDQVANPLRVIRIESANPILKSEAIHLNMLNEKDLTIWSRIFTGFKELRKGLVWEVDKEFPFYDHITIIITEMGQQIDFDLKVIIERS